MKDRGRHAESGYTLVELMVAIFVLSILTLAIMQLFTALVNTALLTKRKAVALSLATNQMEYLKSLSYDSLAVVGGSIVASSPLPATTPKTVNGVKYTVKTSINYVDDAFDGCGSYTPSTLAAKLCRNYPAPTGSATDGNPADYKVIDVSVTDNTGLTLSSVDTEIAARVAETASNTGSISVSVLDGSGNPVSGASVNITDTTSTPAVNVNDTTDVNGIAIFYGLPPDTTGYDYFASGSLTNYSSLTTIPPSGSLQATYSNVQLIAQQSSHVTLVLKPQGSSSLVLETTDSSGSPLAGVKVYVKGGYKKYTDPADTNYYYDNVSPSDVRPTTDASGLIGVNNLVPGNYIFCGDLGATSCTIGATSYYLVAAVPYGGTNPTYPVTVPTYSASSPPSTTYTYNALNYLQKVRLMLVPTSGNATTPRINSLTPGTVSLATSNLSAFAFQLTGVNLPSTSVVKFLQGASIYTATCSGSSGTLLSCTVNLAAVSVGNTQLQITANGKTITLPAAPLLGGLIVTS